MRRKKDGSKEHYTQIQEKRVTAKSIARVHLSKETWFSGKLLANNDCCIVYHSIVSYGRKGRRGAIPIYDHRKEFVKAYKKGGPQEILRTLQKPAIAYVVMMVGPKGPYINLFTTEQKESPAILREVHEINPERRGFSISENPIGLIRCYKDSFQFAAIVIEDINNQLCVCPIERKAG